MNELYTIGHSSHTMNRFIDLLNAHQVRTLADIRTYPGSRTNPQYCQERMRVELATVGIGYQWLPRLGGRRRMVREDSPNIGLTHKAFRSYADYMMTDEFAEGIEELFELMAMGRTAVCCCEGWYMKCHRRLLSDFMVAIRHVPVRHIASRVRATPHVVAEEARIANGLLIYPEEIHEESRAS